jgi:hypothetical protein
MYYRMSTSIYIYIYNNNNNNNNNNKPATHFIKGVHWELSCSTDGAISSGTIVSFVV